MPGAKKNFIGLEGFIWWVGIVEDRQDPEQLGRVRVRCFGWHTEKTDKIPTESLPWAHPIIPINSPSFSTPKEGDMVFGFFIDGDNAQNPAIVGILPGKPEKKPKYENGFADPGKTLSSRPKKPDDAAEKYPKAKYLKEPTVNRLARGKTDSTIIATRKKNLKKGIKSAGGVTWNEPNPAFAPKYPYNNAIETESGHAFELDDTPGAERIQLAHRNGSYIEIDKNGTKLERFQKDNYTVVMGDDFIYIKGKAAITVDGNFNLKTSTINIEASAINMAADGAVKIKGSSVSIESTGAMNMKAGGVGNFTSGGKLSLKGATAALAGATVDIPAGKIGLQSGSAATASGTGLKGGGSSPSAEDVAVAAEEANTASIQSSNTAAQANAVSAAAVAAPATPVSESSKANVSAVSEKTLFGKAVDGASSTVSGIVDTINKNADQILGDFSNGSSPIGELSAKVQGFADTVNDSKGLILGLKQDLKEDALNKIDAVGKQAVSNNIDWNIDSSITDAIDEINNKGVAQTMNVIGKRIFPKTETIKANTSGG